MNYVTRSNVYHNGLDESIHRTEVHYGENDKLTFVFSSELYKNMFENKCITNRENINNSLSKRFKFDVKMNKLADIKLYITTEKRGFLIIGKEEYRCLNNIRLDGENLTLRN